MAAVGSHSPISGMWMAESVLSIASVSPLHPAHWSLIQRTVRTRLETEKS